MITINGDPFSISNEFLDYLIRLKNGERILWHDELRFLFCFSEQFSGDHGRTVHTTWNGMFELISEYDDTGNWERKNPIGIQFDCAHAQLFHSHDLTNKIRDDGTLPVLDLFIDALHFLKGKEGLTTEKRSDCAIAYRFLRRVKLTIPEAEMTKIRARLKTIPRH